MVLLVWERPVAVTAKSKIDVSLIEILNECRMCIVASVGQLKHVLEQCVSGGRCDFVTYGQFSQRFGFGSYARAWAQKPVLDAVAGALKADPKSSWT
jgi:hypothetical protein